MDQFSFADLRRVHWPATAKVGLARGFASGLVFLVINLIMASADASVTWSDILYTIVMLPLSFAVFAVPMGLALLWMGRALDSLLPGFGQLLGAFFMAIGSLMVCLGDPLVQFFNRRFPHALDVPDFRFFNFTQLVFITYPE